MDTGTGSTKVTTTVLEYKAFGKIKHMSRFRQSLPDTDVETVISSVEYDKVNEKELALPAEIRALQSNER